MRNREQAPTLMFLLSGMVSGIYSPNADTQELQLFSTLWPALRLFTPPFAFLYCLAHVDERTQRNGEAFWGHGDAAPSCNLGTCQWVCWRLLPKRVGSSSLGAASWELPLFGGPGEGGFLAPFAARPIPLAGLST